MMEYETELATKICKLRGEVARPYSTREQARVLSRS